VGTGQLSRSDQSKLLSETILLKTVDNLIVLWFSDEMLFTLTTPGKWRMAFVAAKNKTLVQERLLLKNDVQLVANSR